MPDPTRPTPLAERERLKDLLSTDGIIEDGIDAQYAVGFRAHAFEQALNDIADAILADGFRRPLPAVGLGAEERELIAWCIEQAELCENIENTSGTDM